MPGQTPWTPYGLEAIRIAYLRRRRILAGLAAVGIIGIWLLMFTQTTSTQLSISVNGEEQSGIEIEIPDSEPRKQGPVTVAINPGRVTRADTAQASGPTSTIQRTELPQYDRGAPLNWNYYVLLYGPYALLGAAAWFLAKRRGKHDEVNYGVYKGAMPLEMITKSAERQVFTTRWTRASIFGKRRGDYLPAEVLAARSRDEEDA